MLIQFEQIDESTVANLSAALEFVCKKIPPEKDSHELRKRIADAMRACDNNGKRTLVDFQDAGMKALNEIIKPRRFSWFRLGR